MLCKCGCGQKTTVIKYNNKCTGDIAGESRNWIKGHSNKGPRHNWWKGGRYLSKGHWQIQAKNHPRADKHGYVYEALIIAEKTLQKHLPPKAVIHHIDKNTTNNASNNLVICENHSYHIYLHMRDRAFKACGNVDWRKCKYCCAYDDTENMVAKKSGGYHHRICVNIYNRSLKAKRR